MTFSIAFDRRIQRDIQHAVDFYKTKNTKLQLQFLKELENSFAIISKNPFFQIRYNNVRCLPLKKFPYMIHFSVNEENNSIQVHAITCDYKDPNQHYPKLQ